MLFKFAFVLLFLKFTFSCVFHCVFVHAFPKLCGNAFACFGATKMQGTTYVRRKIDTSVQAYKGAYVFSGMKKWVG